MIYNHNLIEKKWQEYWEKNQTYKFHDDNKQKFYALDMFPYPSGSGLHVGHLKGYLATEIIARHKKMLGYDVLHPIGWDAFGLPAEQFAIQTGNHPESFTQKNINNFRSQLKSVGFAFDYTKEVNTTDPKYYQWTQWIFKKLYEAGLAEIKDIDVNWCEGLGTVLSNEEVLTDADGNKVSERGSFPVTKKTMRQWVLKITAYADKLIEGLNEIEFPNSLKALQMNWIGKSDGTIVKFPVKNLACDLNVFTTRVDTIYGVAAIVLAPENPLVKQIVLSEKKAALAEFLKKIENQTDRDRLFSKEKNGFFLGQYAIHPLTKKEIPVWTANYILNNYGTGAIMAVPGHDDADFDFVQKYKLPIVSVIESNALPYIGDGMHINSELINGLKTDAAKKLLNQHLKKYQLGEVKTFYKLRDWIFSRQRYWGEPFPVLFDENNQVHLVNETVELPKMESFKSSGDGQSPLANNQKWVNLTINGKKYRRDTNTMPQWAGSSWYYLAYILKNDDGSYIPLDSALAKEKLKRWLPVDFYIGGQEHAVLHLLYARFWHKFLYDQKILSCPEPFYKLVNQGMILGDNGQKMSKSKGNVVNPTIIVDSHGADALRLYESFMGPVTSSLPWNTKGLDAIRKWIDRLYATLTNLSEFKLLADSDPNFKKIEAKFLQNIENAIDKLSFNVGVSEMMIFINYVNEKKQYTNKALKSFVQVLSLYAPHLAEEIWFNIFKETQSVFHSLWPKYDATDLIDDEYDLPVKINDKLKTIIKVNASWTEAEIKENVLSNEKIQLLLENKIVVKFILITKKIANIITK